MSVLCETSPTGALPEVLPNERTLRKVQERYEGRGTIWGPLNTVTENCSSH